MNQISLSADHPPVQSELNELFEYVNAFVERAAELESVVSISWNESALNPRVHVQFVEWIPEPVRAIELDLAEKYDVWTHVDVQVYRHEAERYTKLYQDAGSANHHEDSEQ